MSIHLEWAAINEYLLLYLFQFALFIPVGKQFCFCIYIYGGKLFIVLYVQFLLIKGILYR